MPEQESHVANETMRPDVDTGRTIEDSVGAAISRVYELQLIAVGMILAKRRPMIIMALPWKTWPRPWRPSARQ